jgi:hypothetical protein
MVYHSMEEKLTDPSTHYKAEIVYPKMMQIKKLSKEITDYIEKLKADAKMKNKLHNDIGKELYNQLKQYKKEVMGIDSGMALAFDTTLILTTRSFDSQNDKKVFFETFFNAKSIEETFSMLSKFQNNVKIMENRFINYFNNKASKAAFIIENFTSYSAIIGQSSTYVRGGENIEITAGVGAFRNYEGQEIIISGKNIQPGIDGAFHYKFKASIKPGKYFIPVQIKYMDQDGKEQVISKDVEYTVIGY